MTNGADADFLQVLRREAWQDLFGNLVFAECGLVLPKTEAPQPNHHVHDGAYNQGVAHIIVQPQETVQGAPKLNTPNRSPRPENPLSTGFPIQVAKRVALTLIFRQRRAPAVDRRGFRARRDDRATFIVAPRGANHW